MSKNKTIAFLVVALLSLGTFMVVIFRISSCLQKNQQGAFFVLFCLCLSCLALSAYMFFQLLGSKFLLFKTIFEHSNEAISILDADGAHIWQNKRNSELFGFSNEELKKQTASFFINTKEVQLKDELDHIKEFSGIFKSKSHNGFKDVFISAYRVEDNLENILCYVQMKREAREYLSVIEKSKLERERILDMALRDPLTKLLNRNGFADAIELKITAAKQGAIIFADIDNFKKVNDTYGHDVGDRVIQHVATVFREAICCSDIVARFGGEEIVAWVEADSTKAMLIAERVRRNIAESIVADNSVEGLSVTCSLGVAEMIGDDYDEAIKRADEAMYEAKKSGKNKVCKK